VRPFVVDDHLFEAAFVALQDRLHRGHDQLQRLQLVGRGRVGVQQIEEQRSDASQLGQPVGLPSR
jgi:hypothetical protein